MVNNPKIESSFHNQNRWKLMPGTSIVIYFIFIIFFIFLSHNLQLIFVYLHLWWLRPDFYLTEMISGFFTVSEMQMVITFIGTDLRRKCNSHRNRSISDPRPSVALNLKAANGFGKRPAMTDTICNLLYILYKLYISYRRVEISAVS